MKKNKNKKSKNEDTGESESSEDECGGGKKRIFCMFWCLKNEVVKIVKIDCILDEVFDYDNMGEESDEGW